MDAEKSIFITGGSTGIGYSLALLYAADGYSVGICGRSADKLPNNYDQSKIHFYQADVSNIEQLQNAVNQFLRITNQRLDIMIANAGRSTGSKQQVPDFNLVRQIAETNYIGVINAFGLATDVFMKQGHGHLVSIASVAGMVGLPGAAAYSSSKAAVLTLGESLAIDFPKHGIDVTTIAPGFIDTPLTQQNDHAMPFKMPVEKAAAKIKLAIDNKRVLYIFPLPMRIFITIAKYLPRNFYRWLMQFKVFNYSRDL